jgi:hypothetical protein
MRHHTGKQQKIKDFIERLSSFLGLFGGDPELYRLVILPIEAISEEEFAGVADGIRTRNIRNHNPGLYH